LSLLYVLWYIKQGFGSKRIFNSRNGAQERKFLGGSQQISEKVAQKLGDERVLLNKAVYAINRVEDNNNGEVTVVKTLDGNEYRTRHLIMALSPAMQAKFHFSPPLPPLRNQLIQKCPMGSVIKVNIYYKEAYWRSRGYCGSSINQGSIEDCPIEFTFDDTKPDGSHPSIIGFILAEHCRKMLTMSPKQREDIVVKAMAETFDCKEMLHAVHYEEMIWAGEQYSGGCYTGTMPPGFLTDYGPVLRKPVGNMYFAGTETATVWTGYMSGAIQAGERAAREVLHAMGKIPSSLIWQEEPVSRDVPPLPFPEGFLERNLPSAQTVSKFGHTLTLGLGLMGAALYIYKRHH
jgi:monoamine oxidase